jgi:hypothetical protein
VSAGTISVRLGTHAKLHVDRALRAETRHFYGTVLGARELPGPGERAAIYELPGGFVAGVFFLDASEVLTPEQHRKATWLELMSEDPAALRDRVLAAGIVEMETGDRSRFFFQAPGGQVFRVAPLDGGM